MYTSKKFKLRSYDEIYEEVLKLSPYSNQIKKVFLADGDALVLSSSKLIKILKLIKSELPKVRRISCYAKPKDLASKTVAELTELKKNGLDLVYVGIESGANEVLQMVNKGETFDSSVMGLLNAKKAGIKSSVMILNGLGGAQLSKIHALKSAELLNITQPEYFSTLVLSFPMGVNHFKSRIQTNFTPLNTIGFIEEMKIIIENTNLENTVFRSDHASNYLVLKGILGRDKELILSNINSVLQNPENAGLREEYMRGL